MVNVPELDGPEIAEGMAVAKYLLAGRFCDGLFCTLRQDVVKQVHDQDQRKESMTRRQIREHIFKLLFNLDFYLDEENEGQMDLYFEAIAPEEAADITRAAGRMEEDGNAGGEEQTWYRIRFEEDEEAEIPEYATQEERLYIADKIRKLIAKLPEIDEAVNAVSKGWKTGRMAKADLAVLRLAVYEIRYDDQIPTGVAINEAVELAKLYGSDQSAAFVNGILARFA